MMTRFESIILEEGRKIVKELGVQLLPNLKISNFISFDSIMKDMKLRIPYQKEFDVALGMYYNEDLYSLATWDFTQFDPI